MTLCAQWNEQTQTPYDIRDRYSVLAGNGVPYQSMESLNAIGRYEYQPVILADGEGLDNPTYAIDGGVISQGGTVISAQEMITRAQSARLSEVASMAQQYGQRVGILATLLSRFGMALPIEPDEAYQTIEDGIAAGAWTPEQLAMVPLLRDAYDRAKEVMTDNDIAAVASVIGGAV
jgi:hypothetical protein